MPLKVNLMVVECIVKSFVLISELPAFISCHTYNIRYRSFEFYCQKFYVELSDWKRIMASSAAAQMPLRSCIE